MKDTFQECDLLDFLTAIINSKKVLVSVTKIDVGFYEVEWEDIHSQHLTQTINVTNNALSVEDVVKKIKKELREIDKQW